MVTGTEARVSLRSARGEVAVYVNEQRVARFPDDEDAVQTVNVLVDVLEALGVRPQQGIEDT